jgi:hypothetical protein
MATDYSTVQETLRYEIDPKPDESMRACTAIAQAAMPPARGGLLILGLCVGVGVLAYFLTPSSRPETFLIGLVAIVATTYGLQAEGRRRLRRLRVDDQHARETHYVELSPDGLHTWCSHIDARYLWLDFTKVTEDREFYLFVRPSGVGSAIPKRLLDDAADQTLRLHIRQWSPDRGSGLARELNSSTSREPSNDR